MANLSSLLYLATQILIILIPLVCVVGLAFYLLGRSVAGRSSHGESVEELREKLVSTREQRDELLGQLDRMDDGLRPAQEASAATIHYETEIANLRAEYDLLTARADRQEAELVSLREGGHDSLVIDEPDETVTAGDGPASQLVDTTTPEEPSSTASSEDRPASVTGETILFRGDDPAGWAPILQGSNGVTAPGIPDETRYIRLRRLDTGEYVIAPATRPQVIENNFGNGHDPAWNGSNDFFFGGHHLGICDPSIANPDVEVRFACGGYGFGHRVDENDRQAQTWGESLLEEPVEFEVAALARDLSPDEAGHLIA